MTTRRFVVVALAVALAMAPLPSAAVAPIFLLLIKQIVRDAAQSTLKNALLSALGASGCKGQAVARALTAAGAVQGGGLSGLGAFAGGMAGSAALPPLAGLPQMPVGGTAPQSATAGLLPFGAGMDLNNAGLAKIAPNAAQIPAGSIPNADQSAQIMAALGKPLSARETAAVLDDMATIGLLSKPVQEEIKECLTLLPEAAPMLGIGFAMLKPSIAQMKSVRAQMQALPPAEQDEIVGVLTSELPAMSPQERAAFAEFAGSSFFPPRMSAALRRVDRPLSPGRPGTIATSCHEAGDER